MRVDAPVVLLGFNRPDKMRNLISSLSPLQPTHILLVVDGPRANNPSDVEKVSEVQECVNLIDWNCSIDTRFRVFNIGLRESVVDGVNWATSIAGQAIVIEDDVEVGPDFLNFMNQMLNRFRDDKSIAHINGYNVVPAHRLSRPEESIRLTRYVESFAWATWDRAWSQYDDSLAWTFSHEFSEILNNRISTIKWRQNFRDAEAGRINTWAYRWMATIWRNHQLVVSPNVNLVSYRGNEHGTHVTRKPKWQDLPIEPYSMMTNVPSPVLVDDSADAWLGRNVFSESLRGLVEGLAVTALLVAKNQHQKYNKKTN